MKAIIVDHKKNLVWSEVPYPKMSDDEVIVKVHAAGINRADLLQRDGLYAPPQGAPEWMGLEVSGVISEIGSEVEKQGIWHVGDKVCALLGGGGYAQYVSVPSGMLMPIPEGISLTEAAAIPEAFGASYLFLFWEGNLKPGETVLVQAGASGLASVLIPMAKSFGARIITTVISDEMAEAISYLNADMVVNTQREKLESVLEKELEQGNGIDIAIDCLGSETVGKCLPYMNYWGRWIIIATLAGDISSIDMRQMYIRRTRLIGTTLRSRSAAQKAELLSDMVETFWPKISSGEVRPNIFKVLPIKDAEEAHEIMRSGKSSGKLILTIEE